MKDRSHEERRTAGLDVLKTLSGGADPGPRAEAIERDNGALGSLVLDYALGDVWSRPGLTRRDRSLIVISTLGALHQERQLRAHVAGGLAHGLTPDEVREVCVQLAGYAGFPRALDAMAATNAAIAEATGKAAGALPPADRKDDKTRRADGALALSGLLNGQIPDDPDGALEAVEGQLGPLGRAALDYAFGEIWSRPQLNRRDRSLVVVSILTALGRKDELVIHLPGAMNHGVTREELEELILMMSAYAGFPAAVEAARTLNEVTAS